MSYCEPAFRQYAAAFDGTKKDFSEVEPLFDALYHNNFTAEKKVYNKEHDKYRIQQVKRDEVKEAHKAYLAKGSKVTIVHYRKIGLNCIDVEACLTSAEEERTVRIVFSIEDGKLAHGEEVDSLPSVFMARFASRPARYDMYFGAKAKAIAKYPVKLWKSCGEAGDFSIKRQAA